MSKRRRSRRPGGYGGQGQGPGQGPGPGPGQGPGQGYQGGGYGRRRRFRRGGGGGGGGGGGPPQAGAGAVDMDSEGMRPPELEPEVAENGEPIPLEPGVGVLEMHPNGYGFLRSVETNYTRERTDPFVPATMIDRYRLREGVYLKALVQPGRRQQGPRVREIESVEGMPPDDYINVKAFDQLTPINPETWLRLETGQQPITTRVMDILTPLGKGQRALIVAPPRTGKTVLLQQVSQAISTNHPELSLVMLLVDERPEEVTDMKRSVKGDVLASSLDCDVESHVRLSQLVVERCKRMAETGKDVFLLMDSITRMARAFNKWVGNTGRTMSGGVDIKALDIPKKLFATARVFEEGGSLTIVATALIDTGSRMDELIFQEFKGTGNMELVLDRKLSDRRVWPAIDISQSGTRREEKLLDPNTLHAVNMLRRTLSSMHHVDAMEQLTKQLAKFKSNREFISLIASSRDD
ncbi:MAG: transcription termination factor Rho [Planctomycetota bacterium]|nr:MAG: transcription termination factor Rho [Planctomycetota bacterium]